MSLFPPRKDVWNPSDPVEDEIAAMADDLEAPGVENMDQVPSDSEDPRTCEERPTRGARETDDLAVNGR